jgi:hypothetical protein
LVSIVKSFLKSFLIGIVKYKIYNLYNTQQDVKHKKMLIMLSVSKLYSVR